MRTCRLVSSRKNHETFEKNIKDEKRKNKAYKMWKNRCLLLNKEEEEDEEMTQE